MIYQVECLVWKFGLKMLSVTERIGSYDTLNYKDIFKSTKNVFHCIFTLYDVLYCYLPNFVFVQQLQGA